MAFRKNIQSRLLIAAVLMMFLYACSVTKPYERPSDAVNFAAIRMENFPADTTNIANLHWADLFTDTQLQSYIREALANNPDAAIAQQQMEIARSLLAQSRAAFGPVVSAGPSVSYNTQSLNTQIGRIVGDRQHNVQFGIDANLSWEADIWGRLRSNKRAAFAAFMQTEAASYVVKSQLVAQVADTYFRLLALDEQMKITRETIETRQKALETSRALKDAGQLTEVAIQQSEAQVLNARGLLLTLANDTKLLENYFSMLIGRTAMAIPRGNFEGQEIAAVLSAGVPVHLLSNRPDVLAAEYELNNAFELTNVAKASFYPALRLNGSTGLQSLELDKLLNPFSFFAGLAGSLTQPLLQRRALRTQKEVSLARQQIAYQQYRHSILNAGREVSDALYNFETQRELASIKQAEYRAYNLATGYSEELLNYALANYLEVLRASENELNARLAFVNARYGTLNAVVQLYQALGGGWK